jgi:hypothetical protein
VRIYVEGDSGFSVANFWKQNGAEWQRADAARVANWARKVLTVESSLRRDRIKVELLHRLRWDIVGCVEDIQVEDGINDDGTPRLTSSLSHAIAAEPIAETPLTHLLLQAMDIDDYSHEQMNVNNEDESPITVRDFVVLAHAHLGAYKYDIPRNMSKPPRRTGRLVFKWAGSTTSDNGIVTVKIWTFMEGLKEEFWERRRVAATKYREIHNLAYE